MTPTWTEMFDYTQLLATEIQKKYPARNLPCYILVGRGGLAVGALMIRFLPMESVLYLPLDTSGSRLLELYVKMYRHQWVRTLEAASHVFLIDDIYDTGRTIETAGKELLTSGVCKRVIAVTIYTRHERLFKQGDHLRAQNIDTNNWVTFPWEVHDPISERR